MSRATMMRMIKELGDQVVVGGAARRTSYAARRAIRGNAQSLPLYKIDEQGRGSQIATLDPIYPTGCLLRVDKEFEWPLLPDMRDGWHPGLPYPLDDMRPQGFLGRNFAHANATTFQVPEDPTKWNEDDVLSVLSVLGSDTQGNLILGESAYRRHLSRLQEGYPLIAENQIDSVYAEQAQLAMTYGVANSSAGGEFPKFTGCRERGGERIHVLVKFSGNDNTPGVQRWSDLLICEHIALNVINKFLPINAAKSEVRQCANRTFLEVERFDRHGEFGRSAVCTWAAIEAAMFGMAGASWIAGARRLLQEGLISEITYTRIITLWHFGKLIANSDMHEGNLAFRPSLTRGLLEIAPAYDMLPMLYAPVRGVELPNRVFNPELPLPSEQDCWTIAARGAIQFWNAAKNDLRICADFRMICSDNAEAVERTLNKI